MVEHGQVESIALGTVMEPPYWSFEKFGNAGSIESIRLQQAALEEDGNPKENRMDSQDCKSRSNSHYLISPSAESSGPYNATLASIFKPSNGSRGATSAQRNGGQNSKLKGIFMTTVNAHTILSIHARNYMESEMIKKKRREIFLLIRFQHKDCIKQLLRISSRTLWKLWVN